MKEAAKHLKDNERRILLFKTYYNKNKNKENTLFNLRGLRIFEYVHTKIQFSFTPSEVVIFISKKITFYVVLKYFKTYWRLSSKSTLPLDCKNEIYNSKVLKQIRYPNDGKINEFIMEIYKLLTHWSRNYEATVLRKYAVNRLFYEENTSS